MKVDTQKKMYVRADCVVDLPEGFNLTNDNVSGLFGSAKRILGTTKIGTYEDVFDCEVGKIIDWEQRRYEIAKTVLASAINSTHVLVTDETGGDREYYAEKAVAVADALIEELKKNER